MEVLLIFFFRNPVRESLVLFLVWHFDTFATLNFDPKTRSRGSQEGGMEKIGRELSGRELSTWVVVSTRKPWSDNVRMCCLIRTQWTISQYHYTSCWISLSSGVHVPPADCQRKINQVELLWKPSPRPLKPNVSGSCAKPLNLKTGINTESSNVFRWNSSKCVNNDVFVSLFGLWLLASELQNGQCPGAWQSLLRLPRSSHTSHETSNFKWKSWGRKEWSKVGIRKNWMHPTAGTLKRPRFQTLWLLPLPWLRCYGLSRSRNMMKDQNKTVKNEHKREREEQPHQKLWTR